MHTWAGQDHQPTKPKKWNKILLLHPSPSPTPTWTKIFLIKIFSGSNNQNNQAKLYVISVFSLNKG